MVGLVYVEPLRLSAVQWGALACNVSGWLWYATVAHRIPKAKEFYAFMIAAIFLLGALLITFWHERLSIDQWLLFWQARELDSLDWHTFVNEFPRRPYLRYQTPFLSFWFSRMPAMWFHQMLWFPFGLLCAGLMRALYGRAAALLLATPVFALMIHQPCHDTLLFGLLLIVLRLIQMGQRALAAFVYGLSWTVKPLTILTVPFILPQLGWFGLGSLAMWAGYVGWSLQWTFGQHQARFLLHQLMLRSMKPSAGVGKRAASSLSLFTQVHAVARKILGTLGWRWEHLGHKALAALPFYLFPAWLRPWSRQGLVLCGIILLGYGNIKYLLLDLLFLFPVQEDVPNMTHQ